MKKLHLKIFAVLVCLTMLIPFAVACKKVDGDSDEPVSNETTIAGSVDTADLYDENGYLKDSLDPTLDFDEYEFNILTWITGYDCDFFAEVNSGDTISDSVFNRNLKVKERLNIEMSANFIEGDNGHRREFVEKTMNSIMSGADCEYDLIGAYSMCSGALATQGALTGLTGLDHLDFSKPWWSQSLIEMSKLGDELYFITGDASNALIYNLYFLVINKDMIKELHLEDPRQKVLDNTWTLDAMFELTKDVYVDNDSEVGPSVGDRFGYVNGSQVHMDCFLAASGIRMAKEDEEGILQLTEEFLGEPTHNLIEKVNDWIWNSGDCYYQQPSGYEVVKKGQALIGASSASAVRGFLENDWEHGIVPYPKANEDQEQFYTNLGFAYTNFCIPINAKDSNMTAAVLECMSSESYRSSAPILFETCLKYRWSTDDLDAPMYDIIKSSIYVDANRLFSSSFEWSKSAVSLFRHCLMENNSNWKSAIDSEKRGINKILADISYDIAG